MTGLLLLFIAVLAANELVLQLAFDRWARLQARRPDPLLLTSLALLAALAVVRAVPAWQPPSRLSAYLLMFAFAATAMAHSNACSRRPAGLVLPRWMLAARRWLPLLMANAVVLAYCVLDAGNLADLAALCFTASLAMVVLDALLPPLLERQRVADVPAALRGAPIAGITAGVLALASMGLVANLPW